MYAYNYWTNGNNVDNFYFLCLLLLGERLQKKIKNKINSRKKKERNKCKNT